MMNVELIPVLELGYSNQEVAVPNQYPYWEHPLVWDTYHRACYQKAGFQEELKPYLLGSSFYSLAEITDRNLQKIILDHTQELREGKYKREQANALFGGYVLRIDGQDKYFPQCCGDLSDIHYWEKLGNGIDGFYAGHPQPQVKIKANTIVLDFSVNEFDEAFVPTPKEVSISIEILSLRAAIEIVKQELKIVEIRLEKINSSNNLNIDQIGELLLWNDANYQ